MLVSILLPLPHPTRCAVQPSDPESYYTAWSSVSGLVKKGLVQKEGNPARLVKQCVCLYACVCVCVCVCTTFV